MPKGPTPNSSFAKTVSSIALVLIGGSIAFGLIALVWQRPQVPTLNPDGQTTGQQNGTDTSGDNAPLQGGVKIKVGFSQQTGSKVKVVPVTRALPSDYEPIQVEYALEELLKGPTAEESERGLYSEIPKGTRLLGVKKNKNGLLVVNLSRQFTTGGGANSLIQRIEEIKLTLRSKADGRKVMLNVEGQPLKILGPEGLEIEQPLDPNAPTQEVLVAEPITTADADLATTP